MTEQQVQTLLMFTGTFLVGVYVGLLIAYIELRRSRNSRG